MAGRDGQSPRRIHGRRKGHRLSARKRRLLEQALPPLRPDLTRPPPRPLGALFDPPADDVWLEIGFGAGEHLAWQARARPDNGFIGCEPYVNGVAALLGEIEQRGLANIRIHDGDARDVLDWLDGASIGRVFLLFPDPWPKTRHHKRRLVSPGTLASLARIMRPGADLRVATDIGDYARGTLQAVRGSEAFAWQADSPADWRARPDDWPATRYEQKALKEGRRACYLVFRRV